MTKRARRFGYLFLPCSVTGAKTTMITAAPQLSINGFLITGVTLTLT